MFLLFQPVSRVYFYLAPISVGVFRSCVPLKGWNPSIVYPINCKPRGMKLCTCVVRGKLGILGLKFVLTL